MKRLIVVALLLLLPTLALGQGSEQHTYVRALDLNVPTESADNDQIVTVVNLTNTTFTIAAQPDVPRNITITVVDTTPSITAGTITVTGTDVNGATITEVLDLSSALTLTGTKVFLTVTSVVSVDAATLGGGGDETIIVGTGSVVGFYYCRTSEPLRGQGTVKTASSSTTVTAGSGAPFALLGAGDDITVTTPATNTSVRRTISTWNSATEVVVDSAVDWSGNGSTGYPFTYRDRVCGPADTDGWHDVGGRSNRLVFLEVVTLSATGGVDYSIECKGLADADTPTRLVSGNITTAVIPGDPSTTFDPVVVPEACAALRIGLRYGTTDTSGTDSISAFLRMQ